MKDSEIAHLQALHNAEVKRRLSERVERVMLDDPERTNVELARRFGLSKTAIANIRQGLKKKSAGGGKVER